jgi:hypothetical protein
MRRASARWTWRAASIFVAGAMISSTVAAPVAAAEDSNPQGWYGVVVRHDKSDYEADDARYTLDLTWRAVLEGSGQPIRVSVTSTQTVTLYNSLPAYGQCPTVSVLTATWANLEATSEFSLSDLTGGALLVGREADYGGGGAAFHFTETGVSQSGNWVPDPVAGLRCETGAAQEFEQQGNGLFGGISGHANDGWTTLSGSIETTDQVTEGKSTISWSLSKDGADCDGDGTPNAVDGDDDDDGLPDPGEAEYGTLPCVSDSDGDGLRDGPEVFEYGTDPASSDTDGDGRRDGDEVLGTPASDPLDPDTDNDGIYDGDEIGLGTDPTNPDTDGDGGLDGSEAIGGSDPKDPNSVLPPGGSEPKPPKPKPNRTPVLLLHGISAPVKSLVPQLDPLSAKHDCESEHYWDVMRHQLDVVGGFTRVQTVGYYGLNEARCDIQLGGYGPVAIGAVDNWSLLNHAQCTTQPGAPVEGSCLNDHAEVTAPGARGLTEEYVHTGNTNIRHVAYHFAWMVQQEFGGGPVNVVGHSMGGLVVRYALSAVQRGDPDFPAKLVIPQVVTVGTPFLGGPRYFGRLCNWWDQCVDLQQGTDRSEVQWFFDQVEGNAPPRGSGRSDWSQIHSMHDGIAPPAESLQFAAHHQYVYNEQITFPKGCVGPSDCDHTDMLKITYGPWDGMYRHNIRQPGTWFATTGMPGTTDVVIRALLGDKH